MSEALKRILYKRFLHEKHPNVSNRLIDLASDEIDMVTFESLQHGESLRLKFCDYQQSVQNGYPGKTTQFWMMYMDLMCNQIQYHTAVQEKDFELWLASIESFILFYFYYNIQNYARYASFYAQVLKCIDKIYPGLKERLVSTGISVQGQDRYLLRTVIDMLGEQTLNRDAKTSGGGGGKSICLFSIVSTKIGYEQVRCSQDKKSSL